MNEISLLEKDISLCRVPFAFGLVVVVLVGFLEMGVLDRLFPAFAVFSIQSPMSYWARTSAGHP
ncbi:MAG TPA: hypothetical protein DDW18_00425 [Firmicutes bacterium]|nr:hypothetical protein [Bacillota bacterium]